MACELIKAEINPRDRYHIMTRSAVNLLYTEFIWKLQL
jgi:hypothetical protein